MEKVGKMGDLRIVCPNNLSRKKLCGLKDFDEYYCFFFLTFYTKAPKLQCINDYRKQSLLTFFNTSQTNGLM